MRLHNMTERIDANLSGSAFEDACLSGLKIRDANLSGLEISECRLDGMTIEGIAVTDLLAAYKARAE